MANEFEDSPARPVIRCSSRQAKGQLQEARARGGELFSFAGDTCIEPVPGQHAIHMPDPCGPQGPILHAVPMPTRSPRGVMNSLSAELHGASGASASTAAAVQQRNRGIAHTACTLSDPASDAWPHRRRVQR